MPFTADKTAAQFWVTITSVVALCLVALVSLAGDTFRNGGRPSEVTMLLAGGLLSIASASTAWLFRNGNGYGYPPVPEVPAVRAPVLPPPPGPP